MGVVKRKPIREGGLMKKSALCLLVGIVIGMLVGGCVPYKGEKFVEVQNNETAFVLPVE